MKGELSVDPSFRALSIKRPTIHLRSPLVAFDGHKIHYADKSAPWSSRNIINCTYVASLDVLMVLCSDWKLYIYNRNLDLIGKLSDWQSKFSVGFEYVEPLNAILLIGVIEVQMMRINIKTNLKQTKFLSSIKFNIERKELRAVEEKNRLSWNKGYGYDIEQGLLYVWSTQNINFYSLSKLQLQSSIVKLVKKQTAITQVHLNRTYKYTITGLINGNVKVWRLPLSPISSQTAEYIMIHNCIHHSRAIQKIVPASDNRLILTSSEDLTLCLWSLQTFELLRAYNFEGEYTSVFLVDQKKAFAINNGQLGELTFGKTMEFIMQIDSPITYFDKAVGQQGWQSFQMTLEANVGVQIRGNQLGKADMNKMQIGYFYPPLKAQSIRQVVASPYVPSTYYMLAEKGQLFSLRFQENSSKIQHSFSIHHALDSQGHPLNQNPTFMAFLDLPDINFDSQITQNSLGIQDHKEQIVQLVSASKQFSLVAIGCSKGSIIILSLNQIDKIRSRLTYHRQMILSMQMIKSQFGYTLASICEERYLRLTTVEKHKASCYFSVFFGENLQIMRSFEDKMVIVFKKGIFEIATAVGPEECQVIQNIDAVDHEGEIFSVDYEPKHRFIMTSASDNRIKIWSTIKILIYQIKVDEGLRYAIWSNNLQIFVAHRNKLLYLRDFSFDTSDIEDQSTVDLKQDKRFVRVGLKKYFGVIKRDQGSEKKQKYFDIDQEYQQIMNKSRTKAHSQAYTRLGKHKGDEEREIKSRAVSFIMGQKEGKGMEKSFKKKKSIQSKPVTASYTTNLRIQQQIRRQTELEGRLKATRKHMEQISQIKKKTNQRLLPKIAAKHQDKFQEFISEKLINKKMLTRRDITLNRIIMKNLIREQFKPEEGGTEELKLDF